MNPKIFQKSPFLVKVEKEKTYYWCACGNSNKQPFCDGSHKGSEYTPLSYMAEETGEVFLCGCKHTKNPPHCDGTHKKL